MIYNNLLYFLTAIFLFSLATIPTDTVLSVWLVVPSYILVFGVFDWFVRRTFLKEVTQQSFGYFRAEKRASLAALVVFVVLIFALDLKYYLSFLSLGNTVPSFVNIAGLMVFLFLLVIIWRRARKSYEIVFSRQYQNRVFILSNIKANLPIVIPWVILTLSYDLISLLPLPWLRELVNTDKGDFLFFGIFIFFVFIFFPPLVRRLWGCSKLPDGPLSEHLTAFCEKQKFTATIYLWPLFEGRVITAGVMGIIPGLRYILITPALIETMTKDELDSIMAHEIGHVKRFHLPLYVFLLGSFVVVSGFLSEPLFYTLFSGDIFYFVVESTRFSPQSVRDVAITVPLLVSLLLFFRFVFGYFMRNFERQADLHVFPVLGNSRAIISAFEKIAILSGNIRDKPSWHHFGIGQRVDFLLKCEEDPGWIRRQHNKVRISLGLYIIILCSTLFFAHQLSFEEEKAIYEISYTRADLLYRANKEDNPANWLAYAGNYFVAHRLEGRAIIAFKLAMEMNPDHPEVLNNFAWLLLTSVDLNLRDIRRALELSKIAAELKPRGYILDTLATAWWANGFTDEAIKTEEQALFVDPQKSSYYKSQLERFRQGTYAEENMRKGFEKKMHILEEVINSDSSVKL